MGSQRVGHDWATDLISELLYNIVVVFAIHCMNQPWVYTCSPFWTPLPPPSASHPSESSQCTGPECPHAWTWTVDLFHISMQGHSKRSEQHKKRRRCRAAHSLCDRSCEQLTGREGGRERTRRRQHRRPSHNLVYTLRAVRNSWKVFSTVIRGSALPLRGIPLAVASRINFSKRIREAGRAIRKLLK